MQCDCLQEDKAEERRGLMAMGERDAGCIQTIRIVLNV